MRRLRDISVAAGLRPAIEPGILPGGFSCKRHRPFRGQSVFGKWFAGSTGDPPVPSGDSPDGTAATVRANGHRLFATLPAAVPVGGSPTGAGGPPAPPILKTGSESPRDLEPFGCGYVFGFPA